MLTLQRESAMDLWDEIMPLLREHKDEIAHYQDIDLDPNIEEYNRCEEAGILRCYTARREFPDINGRELVGYACFFVKPNMHYQGSLQAVQDVLFVTKAHRNSRTGLQLIRFAEDMLKAEGVQVVYQHLKCNRPDTIKLFHRLKYEDIDLIVAKRLDRVERPISTMPEVKYRKMKATDSVNPLIDEALSSAKRLDR